MEKVEQERDLDSELTFDKEGIFHLSGKVPQDCGLLIRAIIKRKTRAIEFGFLVKADNDAFSIGVIALRNNMARLLLPSKARETSIDRILFMQFGPPHENGTLKFEARNCHFGILFDVDDCKAMEKVRLMDFQNCEFAAGFVWPLASIKCDSETVFFGRPVYLELKRSSNSNKVNSNLPRN